MLTVLLCTFVSLHLLVQNGQPCCLIHDILLNCVYDRSRGWCIDLPLTLTPYRSTNLKLEKYEDEHV